MFADVINHGTMICPVCGESLQYNAEDREWFCTGRKVHHFDCAKSGYVNLNLTLAEGDLKEAVRARSAFFNLDLYRSLKNRLVSCLNEYSIPQGLLLDAGCGEGYYTNALASNASNRPVLGIDLSKHGVDAASKSAKRQAIENAGYAVASVAKLPLRTSSVAAVFNIFAPCVEEEYERVLQPGGYLFVAAAGPNHLMGLKKALYDTTYANRERSDMPKQMKHIETISVSDTIQVEGESIMNLFSMTPYYWRTSPADVEKLRHLSVLETPIDFEIFVFRKDDSNAKV